MITKLLFVLPLLVLAADDPWEKVRAVPSGTELRLLKIGAKTPVLAKMDEVTEESLVVVVGDTQTAIPKAQIDRIDARPPQKGSRIVRETKTTKGDGGPGSQNQPMALGKTPASPGSSSSSSSSLSVGGKPGFEPVYRRTTASPKPE
jgi:hypothetical protein